MLTIKQMEALYWVDTLGSFEAAGRKLFTSQAAISKRLQEVETAFDLRLFDRTKRSARLTDRGRDILAQSTEILRLHTTLVESMLQDQPSARRLRIGVTELVALTWLPVLIRQLRHDHAHVSVLPRVDTSETLHQQLAVAKVDMIVVPGIAHRRDASGFVQRHVGQSEQVWMAHPALLRSGKPVPVKTFDSVTVLTLNETSYIGNLTLQWLAEHGVVVREHLSSNSNAALSGMVMAGLGVANLPVHFLPLATNGPLNVIRAQPDLPPIAYRVMYRNDGPIDFHQRIANVIAQCCNFSGDRAVERDARRRPAKP